MEKASASFKIVVLGEGKPENPIEKQPFYLT